MPDFIIRPSIKLIKLGYALAILAALAVGIAVFVTANSFWGFLALFIIAWPAAKHARQRLSKITIEGDKLRYEIGLLTKTSRTIQLTKVQDVTVRQTFKQRLVGIGDLSFETAGETSRLTIANIDEPQAVADRIMEMAQIGTKST
jgi:uncharacterized membrane protein YdbT with pleckstrin-like domain